MKTIRKHIKFYSLLFATAILFYSFKDVDVIVEKTKINQQSGKEIFKSVFFALGDTANKIDVFKKQVETFNNFDANTKTEAYKQIDKLITEIDSKNPTYFDSFKSSIMSGNHLEIEKAIEEGGQKIYDHAPAVFPKFNQIVETVKKDIINDINLGNDVYRTKLDESFTEVKIEGKMDDVILGGFLEGIKGLKLDRRYLSSISNNFCPHIMANFLISVEALSKVNPHIRFYITVVSKQNIVLFVNAGK